MAGSKDANMKELQFRADDGVWRVAFAFDPKRRAIISLPGTRPGWRKSGFTRV